MRGDADARGEVAMTTTPGIDVQGSCVHPVASLHSPIRASRPLGEDRPHDTGDRADGLPTPARSSRTYPDNFSYRCGAGHLGISVDEYTNQRKPAFRWCSYHKRWQLKEEFGPHKRRPDGLDTQCLEGARTKSREYQRRKRAAAKEGAA